MSYLSEPTLDAVFPTTLDFGGEVYTKQTTETLSDDSSVLQFQWCRYDGPADKYVTRFCRPDNNASPVVYYYDQFDQDSGAGMDPENCQLGALSKVASIWNAI